MSNTDILQSVLLATLIVGEWGSWYARLLLSRRLDAVSTRCDALDRRCDALSARCDLQD
jgi:hypothetical protein